MINSYRRPGEATDVLAPLGEPGAGWTLTEEDLGAVAPGGSERDLVLGVMTPHAVELSLERFGLFEQIRALGFSSLALRVEATPPLGHLLRLVSEERLNPLGSSG